ncbi:hypothetical protein PHISCL_03187 [Aspergillus sclerotialis]|uniref:Uncharacterized protein n=1 Tax=Aspergillus sclerotialis TaxID=2070753 RepID=A0A3A3A390_9EURO|nr:hypothetical protein PHISCL_03187 [Aspergillus sclerotialis]
MVRLPSAGAALFGLSLIQFASSEIQWTPPDFDWDSLRCNDTVPSGLWMYKHAVPETTDLSLLSADHATSVDAAGVQLIGITTALGFGWRLANIAAFGTTLYDAVNSCQQTANKEAGVGPCLRGVFGSVVSFGGAASASKRLGKDIGKTLMPHRFFEDGTVNWEMNIIPYNKREVDITQNTHDGFVRRQLRSLSTKEPEFLGYTQDDHRLAKKDFGLHPRVPMFRFDHFKHGQMEITTRDTLNGTFITAAHAGHPTHLLGRRQIQDLKQRMKR